MSSYASMGVQEQKQALRKLVRSRMKELSPEDIVTQSAKVWERLFALPVYQQSRTIGLFLSMPKHEIDTNPALIDAIHNGKTVYVPEVGRNFEFSDMDLIRVILPEGVSAEDKVFHHGWPRNKWGIPEPPESMPRIAAMPGDIDLLVVPGLAFDAKGGRLGQGKGYYDRFIARMRKDFDKPLLVAVGLDPQLVDHIPVTELDFTMDLIIVSNQTVTVKRD